jgi:sigma-E factor negative regulatory protein RseB
VTERITAKNGPGREIIRDNDEVTCIFPDQQFVLVEARDGTDRSQSPLGGRLPSHKSINQESYELISQGQGRMAGRQAEIIAIRPRDSYRYGYRLWLDQPTAMPLKSQLLDEQGLVVEEIMFSEIWLPDEIDAASIQPSLPIETFTWKRTAAVVPPENSAERARWRATELPEGFMLAAVRVKAAGDSGQSMEHLVYSDGLASVSVFVEPGVAAAEQAEGRSRIGAANAYTTTMEGRLITAVGEVPVKTARMIALSVRPISGLP